MLDSGEKFVIGEADEIFELNRDKLAWVGIGYLQLEPRAARRRNKRIRGRAEHSRIAQSLNRLFEISVRGGLADLQAATGSDFLVGVSGRPLDLNRDELGSRDRRAFAGGLLLSWRHGQKQRQDGDELGIAREPLHLARFPTPAAEKFFCFTAISMKALAARLSDLSLRNTMARSRRICASAKLTATSALARMSSSILERAMNPTPTSAATT